LRATREISGCLRLISFDNTVEPLAFALKHAMALNYPVGYEGQIDELLRAHRVRFQNGKLFVNWELRLGDFPEFLSNLNLGVPKFRLPPAHNIFYDAFSPSKNPAMWTLPVFENLFRSLKLDQPCALTTYSRSTLLRATLLLAGFFVGVGHAAGTKEETTVAANILEMIVEPLGQRWLERALRSSSAEPLFQPVYTRAPLSSVTAMRLAQHPQFTNI